jgi:hypothetical protein
MISIKQEPGRMTIQGEAEHNRNAWFLGIGPVASPLLFLAGCLTGLVCGKLYFPDLLE